MRPEVQVLYRPPSGHIAARRQPQPNIESYERDEPRREDQREPAPRGSWLRATAIPSDDGNTRERPVNRSGIRPLERPRARDLAWQCQAPSRRRVEPREMPLVLSDGRLCV